MIAQFGKLFKMAMCDEVGMRAVLMWHLKKKNLTWSRKIKVLAGDSWIRNGG